MTVEEYKKEEYSPAISISTNQTIVKILELMKMTASNFKNYLICGYHTKQQLNEPDLFQTYLQQATKLIRKFGYPFNIDKEYQDIYFENKGFSDLYFYTNEEDESNVSIFSIECKRLPAPPPKSREQEYVKGNNNNGGIERYKKEIHGKGLNECGMLGFVEKETFPFWHQSINSWILDLSYTDAFWQANERLSEVESEKDFAVLKSIVHRMSKKDMCLYHLWVNIQ